MRTTKQTTLSLSLMTALALLAAACGSDTATSADPDTSTVTDGAATTGASETTETTEDDAEDDAEDVSDEGDSEVATTAVSGDDVTGSRPECSTDQFGTGTFIVTGIPANDPDGGLVARSAPGPDNEAFGVLPPDYGVFVSGEIDSCSVVGDSVWWAFSEEGETSWVNSAFLGRYEGIADREAVGTEAALCEAYDFVMGARETDIPVTLGLIELDVELGAHPVGVSAAIFDLINGDGSEASYDTISGYVGPICEDI